jgi:Protein of unknown function (DUF2868)
MNESAAREVTLLQAYETTQPASPHWVDEDRAWADRVAAEAAGPDGKHASFVEQRARHAMQRLLPRDKAAARWIARPLWRMQWLAVSAFVAFLIGLLADSIGPGQRINLLAPPLWGLLLWNALVYIGIVGSLLASILRRGPRAPGPIARGMQALLRIGGRVPKTGPLQRFAELWSVRSAGLLLLRAETVLHIGAAALALGLIAGLYARGLVLDYRAAWQSTFLSADVAHSLVTTVLAPASRITGIALPDAATFATLRAAQGDTTSGAPAAPWIHLLALTLALYVVVPRLVLALLSASRAAARAQRFKMPLSEPYFQRLLRLQRGGAAQIEVFPYAITPTPQAVLGLRAVLAEAFGARVALQIAAAVAFGGEDDAPPVPSPATTHAIAWFDLAATPDPQQHGRFVERLAGAVASDASVVVLIDDGGFRQRFESMPERLAQRREAWRSFCESLGTLPVFVDLEAGDAASVEPVLHAAFARPVQTHR